MVLPKRMRTALDMFGPHDVTTLGDVVQNLETYDDEGWLYVMPENPLRPETVALVVDEGSERDWRVVRELGLVEHHEMFVVKEVLQCQLNRDCEEPASIRSMVRALDSL
jgi:hypothetical protein